MTVTIRRADLDSADLHAFLQAHLDDMEPTAPPESRHALDLNGLRRPGMRVWTAHLHDALVGTAALAPLEPGHEELKSMRTDPEVRGRGIASALVTRTLADASKRDIRRISLETGSMEFFAPARALYARHGFVPCAPFGAYTDDPASTFLTRDLPVP